MNNSAIKLVWLLFSSFNNYMNFIGRVFKTLSAEEYHKDHFFDDDDGINPQKQDEDYQYLVRTPDESFKYAVTLQGKSINLLNQNESITSFKNIPIVCSFSDMDFRLCNQIKKQFLRLLSTPNIILGYTLVCSKMKEVIINRIKNKFYENANVEHIMPIHSMLTLYYLIITQLTAQDDKVLVLTPTYFRFLFTLKDEKRNIVEYQLRSRQTQQGQQFYIDFQELAKLFESNKIKLVVLANPHNPSGRIWKKEELAQMKNLVLKHNCLIFSDDIFGECVENPKEYFSLLNFQELHQNLIWASSYGKGFNCSGNSFTYALIPNQQIREKLDKCVDKLFAKPKIADMKLMESCFSVGEYWRVKTFKYIRENHKIMRQEFKKRNINLVLYTLDCGLISVIDFKNYGWNHTEIKRRLQSKNVFVTYLESCFASKQYEQVTMIRLNFAMNRKLFHELIDRIEQALKN